MEPWLLEERDEDLDLERLLLPDVLLWPDEILLLPPDEWPDWFSATGDRDSDPDETVLSGLEGVLEPREAVGLRRDGEDRWSEMLLLWKDAGDDLGLGVREMRLRWWESSPELFVNKPMKQLKNDLFVFHLCKSENNE